MKRIIILLIAFSAGISMFPQHLFIPMDRGQNDHLNAYGLVYRSLQSGYNVQWLLDYSGGAFIIKDGAPLSGEAGIKGVTHSEIDENSRISITGSLDNNGEKSVLLEKAPSIAVYSPPGKEPWDDAVTLAFDYADIEYDIIYDREIINGALSKYEWLHLHHEDFTGQFDRFYMYYFNEQWFKDMYDFNVSEALSLGYAKYWQMKRDVALRISEYVSRGGFLFSMCSGTNSLDIALALGVQDNIPPVLDRDGMDDIVLDYSSTFAFTGFELNGDNTMNLADINYEPSDRNLWMGMRFKLRYFAPKVDVVESMLTQNHTSYIEEYLGRTTAYDKTKIRKDVIILADAVNEKYAKYIHGNYGEGFFTFLAGHDPEDYVHYVNDPPTDLTLHRNSPGYRLILNNVLFPASREKKKKT